MRALRPLLLLMLLFGVLTTSGCGLVAHAIVHDAVHHHDRHDHHRHKVVIIEEDCEPPRTHRRHRHR